MPDRRPFPALLSSRIAPLRALLLLAVAFALSAGGCAGLQPAAGGGNAPRGHLFIVGGGPRPPELMRRFVTLAGGEGARIVVLPMASGDTATGPANAAELRGLGADAVSLPLTRSQAEADSTARLLEGAAGIWFSGGDQNRLMAVLAGTPAEAAIHRCYREGAVVGGTSAGAAVMTAVMITGDERRPGGSRPDTTQAWITIDRGNVATARGLGLLPGAIVDQHFVRRRRHNRLVTLVLERPDLVGIGIDEATAVEVGPDGLWKVLGESVAVIYDARGARTSAEGQPAGAGLRMHVLRPGGLYQPASGRAWLASAR